MHSHHGKDTRHRAAIMDSTHPNPNDLRPIRKARELTQVEIEAAVGLKQPTISCLERLEPAQFSALAQRLDFPAWELLERMLGEQVWAPREVLYVKASLGPDPMPESVLMAQATQRGLCAEEVFAWLEGSGEMVVVDGQRHWKVYRGPHV